MSNSTNTNENNFVEPTLFKKFEMVGKILAFVISIFTLYQLINSFYKETQNKENENLVKFVDASWKVYLFKDKYAFLADKPEFSKSYSDKMMEFDLKQEFEKSLSVIKIYGDDSNKELKKVQNTAEEIRTNTYAFLGYHSSPNQDKNSPEYKKWESENNARIEKYEKSYIKPEVFSDYLVDYESIELKIIESKTLINDIMNHPCISGAVLLGIIALLFVIFFR